MPAIDLDKLSGMVTFANFGLLSVLLANVYAGEWVQWLFLAGAGTVAVTLWVFHERSPVHKHLHSDPPQPEEVE